MRYLCGKVFCDKRYIRVNGKPVFCVYRPHYFPDMKRTIETWRKIAAKEYKMDLYLCFFESPVYDAKDYIGCGFDAVVDFQPTCVGECIQRCFLTKRTFLILSIHIKNT